MWQVECRTKNIDLGFKEWIARLHNCTIARQQNLQTRNKEQGTINLTEQVDDTTVLTPFVLHIIITDSS